MRIKLAALVAAFFLSATPVYAQVTYLPHPEGCPRRLFCGCGAAVYLFGSPVRSLWPTSAWLKFPRAMPANGMVAYRPGHVFVLEHHIQGDVWMVYDANSGGHRTRRHPRSIRGYRILNPRG